MTSSRSSKAGSPTGRVDLHEDTRAELQAATAYYEAQRDGLGARFVTAVRAAFHLIAEHPGAGRRVEEPAIEVEVRRVLVQGFRHTVYYVTVPRLTVIAVVHQRLPPYFWRDRLRR
ncbi:MAG: type II toxin-antitoxin system RelE/ParE family toxin [Alphaproteobacteria bacterium]|nr:type II toxin-antitoxin system RelE/ParE family toxin [Alphaproteobacteria bacterium]